MDARSDLPLDPAAGQSTQPESPSEAPTPPAPSTQPGPTVVDAPVPESVVVAHAAESPGEATLEPLEGEVASPTTQPVGPRTSRRRWATALGIVAAVVVLSIVTAFTLSSAGQTSLTAGMVPKTALAFATLRTDMPGDQQQKVADLLAHFPGFADQSLLEQSLGETLDKLVRAGTNGKHDYTTEIKPWLGGEIGVAITRAPTPAEPGSGGGLVVVQVKDAAKAEAWIRADMASSQGTAQPDETYRGATLHLYQGHGSTQGSSTSNQVAEALSGQVMLFGDVASVKAGLDAKQQGAGIDSGDQY